MTEIFLAIISCALGAALIAVLLLRRQAARRTDDVIRLQAVTERVRAVGKLVALEVHAKEIATAKSGLSWLPPLLLSDARLAMIFRFEKQYHVDLAEITEGRVRATGSGEFTLEMPAVEGSLRLVDLQPYDIQQGRVLGLVDVIQMNAERQARLIARAQTQAAELFERDDLRYAAQARDAVERQLRGLLQTMGIAVRFEWPSGDAVASGRLAAGEIEDKIESAEAVQG